MADIFLYDVPAFDNPADIKLLITTEAVSSGAVGWPSGHIETPEEAEIAWLKSHGKYVEKAKAPLKRAERRAAERAERVKSKSLKKALEEAADAIAEATERHAAAISEAEAARVTHAINAAISAKKLKDQIAQAHLATQLAKAIADRAEQDDEEQIIMMLLS